MNRLYALIDGIGPIFSRFWTRHPALYYGLFLYFGAVGALQNVAYSILPIGLLLLGAGLLRFSLGALLAVVFGFYLTSSVQVAPAWAEGRIGQACFQITNITPEIRYHRAYYKLQIDLLSFVAKDNTFYAQNVPCKLVWNKPGLRPSADWLYEVEATLTEQNGLWTLHLLTGSVCKPYKRVFSFVEWRYRLKSAFKRFLARYIPPGEVRAFLEGVVIGEFHDPLLANSLRRFGLQHIIVVSGFHFSLIAAIFTGLIRLIASWKVTSVLLILLTTFYLLFVGPSPSVVRAYTATLLVLLANLFEEKSNGINSLGLGLMVALFIEPLWAESLSFTLSFLATWAILLFYPLCRRAIQTYFPRRTGSMLLKMPFLDQLTFVLLAFFLSSFALVASVTILMLPMSLFAFQQFPLLGIIYNCFFPFLVSISVFLLSLGLLFSWLSPVACLFFSSCTHLTEAALTLVRDAPLCFDMTLECSWLSLGVLVAYLCFVSFIGIIYLDRVSDNFKEAR